MKKRERVEQKEITDGKEGFGAGRDRGLQLVLVRVTYVWGK